MRTETAGEDPPTERVDYYAQDRDGNVWWFGRQGVWDVDVAGAEAGLAMPADPRVGDGWRLALLEGVVEDRADRRAGRGRRRSSSAWRATWLPASWCSRTYDGGVGLVRTFNVEGPPGSSELTSGP